MSKITIINATPERLCLLSAQSEPSPEPSPKPELTEGLYWHAATQTLFWVDIRQHLLHCYQPATGHHRYCTTADNPCWLVGLANGGLLLGCRDTLWQVNPLTLKQQLYRQVKHSHSSNRLNDAGTDQQGRLWFGSMDNAEQSASGVLYRLDNSGLRQMHSGYVVTNGPVSSNDGRYLYHASSTERLIYRFALTPTGELGTPDVFIRFTAAMGYPDGMTTDTEGGLWVAQWGGGAVSRFNAQGQLTHQLKMPVINVTNVTNVIFGGPQLNTLYISTARCNMTAQQRQAMPQAGSVFAVTNLPFAGTPATPAQLTVASSS